MTKRFYKVGGCVRDALLGFEPKDIDFVVVGATPEDMLAEGFVQVGADFPVFLKDGCEYALARKERKVAAGYHGFETEFDVSVTLEADLGRRDLTINSMAMDEYGNVIDPFGGKKDLESKVLRHCSPAFAEDPLRVLRVARFAARYADFKIAYETNQLMRKIVNDGELQHLAKERVWVEFRKAMEEKAPQNFINALNGCGALKVVWPKMASFSLKSIDALVLAKLNSVEYRMAYLVMLYGLPHFPVPSDIQELARNAKRLSAMLDAEKLDVDVLMDIMEDFRVSHYINKMSQAVGFLTEMDDRIRSKWPMLLVACSAFADVKFENLPEELKNSLRGKHISEELKARRREAVEKAIAKYC